MIADVIATCSEVEAEIYRVLTEKFGWKPALALQTINLSLVRSTRVKIRGTIKYCRDPKDDMFLECAERAQADLLISGDKHLIVLGFYKATQIVTPAQYLAISK